MRIDKLLSNLKYGTRNEIKKAMKNNFVTVNGEIVKNAGQNINPLVDKITFDDEVVYYADPVFLMLNKPQGYVSSNKDGLHKTVFDLIKEPYNRFDLKIAGRLDLDTEGLLLLTNNGDLIHSIITPKKDVFKKYFVRVDQSFDCNSLLKDIEILDGRDLPFKPMKPIVEKISDTEFYLSIREGKFHQVKRMCEYFSRTVVYLKRVSIGEIELDPSLKLGEYKEVN